MFWKQFGNFIDLDPDLDSSYFLNPDTINPEDLPRIFFEFIAQKDAFLSKV